LADNTNQQNLELYGLLAEQDNSGIPIAYLFLSTAASIKRDKRTTVLTTFLTQIRNLYGVNPRFVHTDKDMAEIQAGRNVWPGAKHQLCWWHLHEAVRKRLAKEKTSTTLYNANKAHEILNFINEHWVPLAGSDPKEREGEESDPSFAETAEEVPSTPGQSNPNALPRLRLPGRHPETAGHGGGPARLILAEEMQLAPLLSAADRALEGRRFCPKVFQEPLLKLMEQHFHAHPNIPAMDHAPTPEGIYYWAVKQMYDFCCQNELVNVWAYMWENWYRPSRWGLWSRAQCREIPRLKTKMICESQ
jgi:hypothetical protein